MRLLTIGLLGFLLFVAAPGVRAGCGDDPGDDAAVAAARTQVATDCPCDTSGHGQYVKCAKTVAKQRATADPPTLRAECKGQVVRCAAKSRCGKPGFVQCCYPRDDGSTGNKALRANICEKRTGVASNCSSSCDACGKDPSGPSCSPSGAFLDEPSSF